MFTNFAVKTKFKKPEVLKNRDKNLPQCSAELVVIHVWF